MEKEMQKIEAVLAFWNSRAGLGQSAGSRDVIAKQLEMEALAKYVHDGMRILEVGCGNGITAIELARRFDVTLVGIDYAQEMVSAAKEMAGKQLLRGQLQFQVGDVQRLVELKDARFDLIYTERVIINLPDWPAQRQAISDICQLLVQGGAFVMLENSHDGLDSINVLRTRVGLAAISSPWHNRYLRDDELDQLAIPNVILEKKDFYSSTYYFLSRVVNAWLAKREDKEPEYEAAVNQLALELPAIGQLGQGRIWLWRKNEVKQK